MNRIKFKWDVSNATYCYLIVISATFKTMPLCVKCAGQFAYDALFTNITHRRGACDVVLTEIIGIQKNIALI